MAEAVLVHGYWGTFWGRNCGFSNFDSAIAQGTAVPYEWGTTKHKIIPALLAPLTHYKEERDFADSFPVAKGLGTLILQEQPHTLLGHSLGGRIICNYLNFGLVLGSVRRIITVLPDVDVRTSLINPDIQKALDTGELEWINFFNARDPFLAISRNINRYQQAGASGFRIHGVENREYAPEGKEPHTASLHDLMFRGLVFNSLRAPKAQIQV